MPRVLVISGSMGAGKTTVMGEASDILSARGVAHAAFDLDALGIVLLPDPLSGSFTLETSPRSTTTALKPALSPS